MPGPGSTPSGTNDTVTNNTINEPCAGILLGSSATSTVVPNTFFNVTHTTLPGDSCPAAVAAATSRVAFTENHSFVRRPSPLKRQ